MELILNDIDWRGVSRSVRVETRNREVYQPLISMYRWWARRPHSLMGALLDAARNQIDERPVIADPFSGGGTVAIEAARRGYQIYAQDINPWAAWGLKVCLTPIDPSELRQAGEFFLEQLEDAHSELYGTALSEGPAGRISHAFRVRSGRCKDCSETLWVFPYALLTLASRSLKEKFAYFGCRKCGSVSRHHFDSKRQHCLKCGLLLRLQARDSNTYVDDKCPHCRRPKISHDGMTKCGWSLVLVQRLHELGARKVLSIGVPTDEEKKLEQFDELSVPSCLQQPIPEGMETSRLIRAGFTTWADLYPSRQLRVLLSAANTLAKSDLPDPIRDRLTLCVIGAAEMPGHLCRWDRFHPKVFEALSNHRYSFDGLAVEPNPLSPVGRGSLHRRVAASIRAAHWLRDNVPSDNVVAYTRAADGMTKQTRTSIVQGSSERQLLQDESASLILTDPPYFDSVQYGELASLFLTWMKAAGVHTLSGEFDAAREAVPNRSRKTDGSNYLNILTSIFRECGRTLAPKGRLILTYHSTNLRAWAALGTALAETGFRIAGLSAVNSENASDHSKRGTRAFVSDLLIECVKTDKPVPIQIVRPPRSAEERELLHVGQAIAEAGTAGYAKLRDIFVRRSGRMRDRRIGTPTLNS